MEDFNQYQNTPSPAPVPASQPPRRSSAMSTASLVLGICSLVLMCCGAGPLFGALGIIFAILSRTGKDMDGNAKVGLGLSIAGTIVSIIVYIAYFAAIIQTDEYRTLFREYYNYYYDDYYDYFDDYDDYFYDDNSINDLLDRYYNGSQDTGDKIL